MKDSDNSLLMALVAATAFVLMLLSIVVVNAMNIQSGTEVHTACIEAGGKMVLVDSHTVGCDATGR